MFFSFRVHAQSGTLKGIVIDEKTKEPIPFACVAIEKDGKIITGASADINGNYKIISIPTGVYVLKATTIGYFTKTINNIEIKEDYLIVQNIDLAQIEIIFLDFTDDFYPIIDKGPAPSGQTITSYEIKNMAW
jgi:hypothetical protein